MRQLPESDARIFYSKEDAATVLAVQPRTIDELRRSNELVGVLHKGRYVFPRSELERYAAKVMEAS